MAITTNYRLQTTNFKLLLMLKNYFKTALRILTTNKVFSVINIGGLALGITCTMLIMLWVQNERSFDGFHKNNASLYRVMETQKYADGRLEATPSTPGLLAEALAKEIPEVKNAVTLTVSNSMLLQANNKSLRYSVSYTGNDFFKMFTFPLVIGNQNTLLTSPADVVITKKIAEAFFGTTDVIGKVLKLNNKTNVQVAGVIDNVPDNSSIQFDLLLPYSVFLKENDWALDWGNQWPRTFIQLQANTTGGKVASKIKNFIQAKQPGSNITLFLQRFSDSYLYSKFTNGVQDGGRINYVNIFTWVAILVLAIACINFTNLSTARSIKRAREIGVRKVVGAVRTSLIIQFMSEALVITFLSMVLAVFIVYLFLPAFNSVTGKSIALNFTLPSFWVLLASILFITTILAGVYPAFFLSSLKPVRILKGSLKFSLSNVLLRKGLVVVQFTMSVILIVGMMVIYFQINYLKNKDQGYNRDNLVVLPLERAMVANLPAYKSDLSTFPGIENISFASQPPGEIEESTGGVSWPGKDEKQVTEFFFTLSDYSYIPTMKLQLAVGRNFSPAFADSNSVIINEEAARRMNMKDPLGKKINFWRKEHTIVGVLKDFHLTSMHEAIQPFILHIAPEAEGYNYILARVAAGKTPAALQKLAQLNKKYNAAYPFEYEFMDKTFERQYKSELVVEKLAAYFAGFAIIIACLGLLGLTIFSVQQKMKEISVRKILGAGFANVISLVAKEIVILIGIAFMIALPVAIYFGKQWLTGFAYRVQLQWWMFALAAGATLAIALVTISFQAVKAAVANPVKALRSE